MLYNELCTPSPPPSKIVDHIVGPSVITGELDSYLQLHSIGTIGAVPPFALATYKRPLLPPNLRGHQNVRVHILHFCFTKWLLLLLWSTNWPHCRKWYMTVTNYIMYWYAFRVVLPKTACENYTAPPSGDITMTSFSVCKRITSSRIGVKLMMNTILMSEPSFWVQAGSRPLQKQKSINFRV